MEARKMLFFSATYLGAFFIELDRVSNSEIHQIDFDFNIKKSMGIFDKNSADESLDLIPEMPLCFQIRAGKQ